MQYIFKRLALTRAYTARISTTISEGNKRVFRTEEMIKERSGARARDKKKMENKDGRTLKVERAVRQCGR